jgi:phosphoesterase RecJ-like protein
MKMERFDLQQTGSFLRSCEDAHILIHRSPDGDCIGAGYSLQAVLRGMGKRAKVLCADPVPARFDYLRPKEPEEDFAPGCVIAVDVADEKLFGSLSESYGGRVALCIDHHVSNLQYAEHLLLDPHAAAACEILYKLYRDMGVQFTRRIAMCLYTGMATDTGCFKFDNTNPETHSFTAELMREFPDIPYGKINRAMFDLKSPSRLRAEIRMLSRMEYFLDGKCAMICADRSLMEETGMKEQDTEGMAGLPLQTEGVEVGITVREHEPGVFRVSLRSANDVNVSEICKTFGGGGHIKAAGCTIEGTLPEIRQRLISAVEKGLEKV